MADSKSKFESSCEAVVEGGSAGLRDGVCIGSWIGSSGFVSLMESTIFSRSTGVMCFSRPLPLLWQQSSRRNSGRAFGMVVAVEGGDGMGSSSVSSEDAESRLDESPGTAGMSVAAAFGVFEKWYCGARVDRDCGSKAPQHKVSRFQSRQLRFSSRLPSSVACDVLENNDHWVCQQTLTQRFGAPSEPTIPKRFSTEVVSIV